MPRDWWGSYMPSCGVSVWNFYLPYGCVPEQVVHPRGVGTILVRLVHFGTWSVHFNELCRYCDVFRLWFWTSVSFDFVCFYFILFSFSFLNEQRWCPSTGSQKVDRVPLVHYWIILLKTILLLHTLQIVLLLKVSTDHMY